MKGPFGLLLIGGGIILLVGLFSGKITFGPPAPGPTPVSGSSGAAGGGSSSAG